MARFCQRQARAEITDRPLPARVSAVVLVAIQVGLGACESKSSRSTDISSSTATTDETAAVANSTAFDCQGIGPLINCLSGFIATQGFSLIRVNPLDGRTPSGDSRNFVDAADFADRFTSASVVPSIEAYFKSQGQSFISSDWLITLTPEITRTNFGTNFTVDLQGPVSVTADIKNTGKFQISRLPSGEYNLRLYKELTLTYSNATTGDGHTDCVVLEHLRNVTLGDGSRHQELGAISDLAFYVRSGKACDGAAPAATGSPQPTASPDAETASADPTEAPGNESSETTSSSTATDTTSPNPTQSATGTAFSEATSSSTATGTVSQDAPQASPPSQPAPGPTPAPTPPLVTFSAVLRDYCADEAFVSIAPSTSGNPWIITKVGRDLRSQQVDRNSSGLDSVGPIVTINGSGNACINTAYTPTFQSATAGEGLLVNWNCTGDGVNRYWRKVISAAGGLVAENNYVGATLGYDTCAYSSGIELLKCGTSLIHSDLTLDRVVSAPGTGTGLNAEIGTTTGFASIEGSTLRIYDYATTSTCSIALGGLGMGLVEMGDMLIAYNGRLLEKIQISSCSKVAPINVRSGTDPFFIEAPTLFVSEGKIIVVGKQQYALHFEEVILTPSVSLGRSLQTAIPATVGRAFAVNGVNGTRIVTAIETSGCVQIRSSGVLP